MTSKSSLPESSAFLSSTVSSTTSAFFFCSAGRSNSWLYWYQSLPSPPIVRLQCSTMVMSLQTSVVRAWSSTMRGLSGGDTARCAVACVTRLRIWVEDITDATRTSYLGWSSATMDSWGPMRAALCGRGSWGRCFFGWSGGCKASVGCLRFFGPLLAVVVDMVAW
ncbi:hypothetical protein TCAP_02588, partial [Tolypocladium capitatum]